MTSYEDDIKLDEYITDAKDAIADEGMLVSVKKQILSLTASSDGGALMVLAVALPSGTLAWFGQQLAKSIDSRVHASFSRLRRSSVGDLLVYADGIRVLIESDLPDDAILQLADWPPDAPSGELRYDRVRQTWMDSNDWKVNGGR